ncbi:MAG: sugar transferase [Okeania sp. SIO3I5]|uniref:sugar transferase n=1 Tax=Okeania sp. SIO3I5 TaxID=2607805 RepID=UPI0013BAB672|nr:sugar transferase [Okeania sp. SIO3I5]NEQ38349.1 sugar transferase [Okeania sp. SIO3I5]
MFKDNKKILGSQKPITPDVQKSKFDQRAPQRILSLSPGTRVGWLRTILFVFLDAIVVSICWKTAQWISNNFNIFSAIPSFDLVGNSVDRPGFLLSILLITLNSIAAAGLYGERESRRQYFKLIKSLTFAQVIILFLAFLYEPEAIFSRSTFLLAWLFNLIFVLAGRLILEGNITNIRRRGKLPKKIFLVGTAQDTLVAKIALKLVGNKEYKILGQIDLSIKENLHRWQKILEDISQQKVGEIFVCSWESIPNYMDFYWSLKTAGIHLRVLPVGLNIPSQVPKIDMIGGMPTIIFSPPMIIGSDYWLKRSFDLVLSTLVLIFAIPLFLLIAILIKLDSPGPIFYQQTRVGLRCRHFKLWKFRTMVRNAEQLHKKLEEQNEIKGGVLFKMKDDPRITKIGKFLRRSSLDELPQLFNVLMGQMSLVGPRPLALRDFEGLSEHHLIRHNVMPGITGLWQVSGRSNIIDFENAFRLDMMYINNWSLALDFMILLKTIKVVLFPDGAY